MSRLRRKPHRDEEDDYLARGLGAFAAAGDMSYEDEKVEEAPEEKPEGGDLDQPTESGHQNGTFGNVFEKGFANQSD